MRHCSYQDHGKFGAKADDWNELLGRSTGSQDPSVARFAHADKSVLITGAGGSIGSALASQVASMAPRTLVLLDSSEHNLYRLDAHLRRRSNDARHVTVVGSVADADLISAVCALHPPDSIYHAAAYKHVPLMESNPFAAMQNNALGTYLLAQEARRHGVGQILMVSTDKAVNPTSIMGASKRIAEMVLQTYSNPQTRMNSIRLGNVLGSQGSVVPLFLDQLCRGEALTVTHPDVERFFFTMQEAVSLVLESATIPSHGEVLISDSTHSTRVRDLAKFLIARSGPQLEDTAITYTGLRPGEKLAEEFVAQDESLGELASPRLRRVEGVRRNEEELESAISELDRSIRVRDLSAMLSVLQRLVPTYTPSATVLQNESAMRPSLHV
ncbi:MAG: polysaccharide biosynthesis protein [Acidobacteriaceae bacterium]